MEEKNANQKSGKTGREPDVSARNGKRRHVVVAGIAAVVVAALCAGGYAAWRVHENRLDEQARTDCTSAAKTLKASRTAWEKLLNDAKTGTGRIQASQVKDPKTVDALKKAMNVRTPDGSASCIAGTRDQVDSATKAINHAARAYDADSAALRKAVKAVEVSKLDRTVVDATKLLNDTKGKVKDDTTRQTLDRAIRARDEQAIAKAVKDVNDSKAAKDKADAETKAKREAEEAAAAKAAQQQAAASSSSGYSGSYGYNSGSYGSSYSNSNRSYSTPTPSSNGSTSSTPSTSTPSQSTSSSNGSAGASDGFDWNAGDQYDCKPGKFCPLG